MKRFSLAHLEKALPAGKISGPGELARALPALILAAAKAVPIAEQRLGYILALRAAGQPLKGSDISSARMALARALRDAEDLQRIQSVLPLILEKPAGHLAHPAAKGNTPALAGVTVTR